jgi:hypothetical protein
MVTTQTKKKKRSLAKEKMNFITWLRLRYSKPAPEIPTPDHPRVSTLDEILRDDWYSPKAKRTKEVKEDGSKKEMDRGSSEPKTQGLLHTHDQGNMHSKAKSAGTAVQADGKKTLTQTVSDVPLDWYTPKAKNSDAQG